MEKETENVQQGAPIEITERAAHKLAQLLAEEGNPELKWRLYVTGGGCSGLQYNFALDPGSRPGDAVIAQNGVTLLVDPRSLSVLVGSRIDFKEDLEGAQFTIDNPNAVRTCSCGSSFCV
ncbi:iron-sulfur cluster insertion protein ErpA [Candidatus Methylacidithermus pantelleriae]|uniref:Iron-sulfur cluster insertion protein ErpA n=1 Tax=Candidatus Methylacidithermus pantelleriae TaxID=2744239 RepID=A0A8J2BR77_9BACT|nr:iron-sulfur cluster insertion protein ErpA [Candidatus Methylacidithermus pantelleriae]CAF0703928.1 iron-sulfur cluster insertion protein ErpA [Candidatus Methylacidithermus pantelleriae]